MEAAQRGRIEGAVQPAGRLVPEHDPCMTSEHNTTAIWIRLGVDFEEGGNRSARRKPSKSGWDRLKLNRQNNICCRGGRSDWFPTSTALEIYPDINPIQRGLTSVNRPENRCLPLVLAVHDVGFGQSRSGRLITNSVCTWLSEWHICKLESPQETRFYASHIHEFKNWVLSNKLIKVELPPWKI